MRAPFCDRWQKKVWQVRIQTEAVKCSRPRPTRPGRGGRTERESQTGVSDNAVSKTAGDRQNMAGCKSKCIEQSSTHRGTSHRKLELWPRAQFTRRTAWQTLQENDGAKQLLETTTRGRQVLGCQRSLGKTELSHG